MSLIINTVKSASSQITYNYLESQNIFGYDIVANYTIDFSDISFVNDEGVLWEGIDALNEAYIRKNVIARIGADEFVNGQVTSVSYGSSAMVGANEAKITIQESKRLSDYSNNVFAQNIPSPQWLSAFSEDYSFTRSGSTYSYTRNVSIQYKQDAGDQFLNNARVFLRNFYLDNRPNFGFQTDGISEYARADSGFKTLLSETYDLIGLSVSISENFESSEIVDDFSKKQAYNLAINEFGFTEKKYTIEIKALKEPLEYVATEAYKTVIDELVAANSALGTPISIEKGINKDGGIISLSVSFSNDPSKSQGNNLVYTSVKTKRGIFYDYSLSMEFSSSGASIEEKLANVKSYWQSANGNMTDKIVFLFGETDSLYEMSASVSFDLYNGKIKQEVPHTTDPDYNSSSFPNGILKRSHSRETQESIKRISTIVDLADEKEKGVISEGTSLEEVSETLSIVCKKSKGMFFGVDYLDGLDLLGADQYLNSDTLNLDMSAGSSSRVISYTIA